MQKAKKDSSGVQELIDRISNEGVKESRKEANKIIKEAKQKAAKIIADAEKLAEKKLAKEQKEIEALKVSSLDALHLSARDTLLDLKAKVSASFESFVKSLITDTTHDDEFIKTLILVLAGQAEEQFIKDKEIQILISDAILTGKPNPKLRKKGKDAILTLSTEMLREGVELIPSSDIHGGAQVKIVKEQLKIDLSDKAIAEMLFENLLPRFRAIFEGREDAPGFETEAS